MFKRAPHEKNSIKELKSNIKKCVCVGGDLVESTNKRSIFFQKQSAMPLSSRGSLFEVERRGYKESLKPYKLK